MSELGSFKFLVNQGVRNLVECLVEVSSVCVIDVLVFIVHQLGVGPHRAGLSVEGEKKSMNNNKLSKEFM